MCLTPNSDVQRVRLIFANDRPAGSSAVLDITTTLGRVAADLDSRHGRALHVLADALNQDASRPLTLMGLRHPERIAELLDPSPTAYIPSEFAIRSYFSQINRRLRDAWARIGLLPPKIFVSLRGAGFKRLYPIEVEYLERTRQW